MIITMLHQYKHKVVSFLWCENGCFVIDFQTNVQRSIETFISILTLTKIIVDSTIE